MQHNSEYMISNADHEWLAFWGSIAIHLNLMLKVPRRWEKRKPKKKQKIIIINKKGKHNHHTPSPYIFLEKKKMKGKEQ